MKIGDKEYSKIIVKDADYNMIAIITDNDIIKVNNCKVCFWPVIEETLKMTGTSNKGEEKRESIAEMEKRYSENPRQFAVNEIFRIFYETEDKGIKLEALKVLAAQL